MDTSPADIAVHTLLLVVTLWAVLGNPAAEKARVVSDQIRFPLMTRTRVALLVAGGALLWRFSMRAMEGQGGIFPLLLAAGLFLYWLFARELVVDKKGVHEVRLFGWLRSVTPWKKIARAEVAIRRRGGRKRVTVRVLARDGELAVVHGGALVDPQRFVEELGKRGVKIEELDGSAA